MGIVNEPVKDGVSKRRIADRLVPVVDRDLTGDDGRARAVPVVGFGEQWNGKSS